MPATSVLTGTVHARSSRPRTAALTRSATGVGAQPCVVSKTPYPARKHTSIPPRQPANPRPTGIPSPAVMSTVWTRALESRKKLDTTTKSAVKKEAVKPKATKPEAVKPRVVKPKSPTPAAPALKSALKSSSKEKTEKKVTFDDFDRMATINEHAVWSRPEPSVPTKQPPTLYNAAFNLDLTKFMDT
ncbi:MAG: hypothetical protein Q9225_002706 [Loekoesia sp. 1 TL-2023]